MKDGERWQLQKHQKEKVPRGWKPGKLREDLRLYMTQQMVACIPSQVTSAKEEIMKHVPDIYLDKLMKSIMEHL